MSRSWINFRITAFWNTLIAIFIFSIYIMKINDFLTFINVKVIGTALSQMIYMNIQIAFLLRTYGEFQKGMA